MATVTVLTREKSRAFLAKRNALVEAHMHLVAPIAARLARKLPPSFPLADLENEGMLGLIDAATKYRPREHNGTPFSAYARIRIHGAIQDSTRRRHYEQATALPLEAAPDRFEVPNMEERIDAARLARRVREAVIELPMRQQNVIAAQIQGKASEDTAQGLGLCDSRVRQIRAAAVQALKGKLAG